MDNNDCCGNKSCCDQDTSNLDQNISKESKAKTTCCGCQSCTCGDNCLCPTGKISCEPCQEFVDSKK